MSSTTVQIQVLGMKLIPTDLKDNWSLSGVELKVKTRWTYMKLPLSLGGNQSEPLTLPTYIPSSDGEPLFLFVEVWKNGTLLEGLAEVNLRHLINQHGTDVIKVTHF
jgi:hypothetical protein